MIRSAIPLLDFPRTPSKRSRIASLTAAVMLSPVRCAGYRAKRWVFSSLIFRLIWFHLSTITVYHYHRPLPLEVMAFSVVCSRHKTAPRRASAEAQTTNTESLIHRGAAPHPRSQDAKHVCMEMHA